jgi:internalin A
MISDREILATLIEKIGVTPKSAEYDDADCLTRLDFSHSGIAVLPPEIGKLANLWSLSLRGNHLNQLPSELTCLINLYDLDLSDNNLTRLPSDFSGLINLA